MITWIHANLCKLHLKRDMNTSQLKEVQIKHRLNFQNLKNRDVRYARVWHAKLKHKPRWSIDGSSKTWRLAITLTSFETKLNLQYKQCKRTNSPQTNLVYFDTDIFARAVWSFGLAPNCTARAIRGHHSPLVVLLWYFELVLSFYGLWTLFCCNCCFRDISRYSCLSRDVRVHITIIVCKSWCDRV